jgi:small-conductance mechanosensitive channel
MDLLSTTHLTAVADNIATILVTFVPRLVTALFIIGGAVFLARRAAQGVSKLIGRSNHFDPSIRFVVAEFIRYAIIIFALLAALEQVGV